LNFIHLPASIDCNVQTHLIKQARSSIQTSDILTKINFILASISVKCEWTRAVKHNLKHILCSEVNFLSLRHPQTLGTDAIAHCATESLFKQILNRNTRINQEGVGMQEANGQVVTSSPLNQRSWVFIPGPVPVGFGYFLVLPTRLDRSPTHNYYPLRPP